jgi:hypothetical protein
MAMGGLRDDLIEIIDSDEEDEFSDDEEHRWPKDCSETIAKQLRTGGLDPEALCECMTSCREILNGQQR